ncbi:rhomboid family intramembrane serine protease [Radiobacillus sp. PE A8.2]|uniref:rhomboid family intramembrane serine protease n=1 Tax=Radiobacillus sp. PE A8.2 TaxID=3380349 RepID=UPI00388F7973
MFIRTESFREFIRFYPIVTSIIALQLVIWLITFLGLPFGNEILQLGTGVNYAVSAGQYWRIVTPIFIHDPYGVMHVLFNSFSLVLFGPALEQMLGKFKFILTYLLTGIVGNLVPFFLDPLSIQAHYGASGAVYGLFGVYAYMVFMRKDLIDKANAQIVTVIIVIGLIMTFLQPGIHVEGHLFGFIAGLVLGPIMLIGSKAFSPWRNRRAPREGSVNFNPNRWQKKRRMNSWGKPVLWIIIGGLVLIGIFGRLLQSFF